jgi:ribose 5-phosphate isomerase A
MNKIDQLKRMAAHRAVEYVQSGMTIGLGSGSTFRFVLERIGDLLRSGRLKDVAGVPSSNQTQKIAEQMGIPLTAFEHEPLLDLTIDGADEVDPELNLIKGGGGALLREKILAQSSRCNIIIVDYRKMSLQLGTRWALPIEVLPFALRPTHKYLAELGAAVSVRKTAAGDPLRTDQDNLILDANFGPIEDLQDLAFKLSARAGIIAHGLFLGLADKVIVAEKDGIKHLKRHRSRS